MTASPVHAAGELIKIAKERPGQLLRGSSGIGGPPHICTELCRQLPARRDPPPAHGNDQTILDVVAALSLFFT
jgi:hypothetical protein